MTRAITNRGKREFLTMREEKALAIYVSQNCIDMYAAMVAAGYPKRSAQQVGNRLLKTQKAKEYLAGKIETALKQYNKTADDTLAEAALIAHFDPADVFKKGPGDEVMLKSIFEMGPARRAIKKIEHTQHVFGSEKVVSNTYKYEFWSKTEMIKLLAQYHRLINSDNQNTTIVMPLVYIPDNGRDKPGKIE